MNELFIFLAILAVAFFAALRAQWPKAPPSAPPPALPPKGQSKDKFIAALKIPPTLRISAPAIERAFRHLYDDYYKFNPGYTNDEGVLRPAREAIVSFAKQLPPPADPTSLFSISLQNSSLEEWRQFLDPLTHLMQISTITMEPEYRHPRMIRKYGTAYPKVYDAVDEVFQFCELLGLLSCEGFDFKYPFDIPDDRWFEGTWIVAAQGRGKTNLLRHLILHHLSDASIIILDARAFLD